METIELQNGSEEAVKARLENEPIGNKLENLVHRKKSEDKAKHGDKALADVVEVHHDIGVMFIYQADMGILPKLTVNVGSVVKEEYMETYEVYIETIKTLYNAYNSDDGSLRLDFVLINKSQYLNYTGNTAPDLCADTFLYFIVTPCDSNKIPIDKHFKILNLDHTFDIGQDFIDGTELEELAIAYRESSLFSDMSEYRGSKDPTYGIYYKWEDVKKIIDETNSQGQSYEKVEFVLGEIIPYEAISNFFRKNPTYGLDEVKYRRAYDGHEKRLTVLGKYMPEEILGKEGYFDMGSLYP